VLYSRIQSFKVPLSVRSSISVSPSHIHRRTLRRYEGYRYPHFLDWGVTVPLTFRDEKVKNLTVTCCQVVNRGDLRRLNYNIQSEFSAAAPLGEHTMLSQTPRVGWGGILPPRSPSLSPRRTQGRLILLLNWYPHILDQSYAPAHIFGPFRYHKPKYFGKLFYCIIPHSFLFL